MSRLILVEDEPLLAKSLLSGLREEQFVVDWAATGDEALWLARSERHDAMILDLRIPTISGLEVCRMLRGEGSRLPILMLTAFDATDDVVRGLDAGANDYLKKPFEFAELLARLRAVMRSVASATSSVLRIDDLEIDLAARRVTRAGMAIELSMTEYRILEHLARNRGRVQSKDRIIEAAWDDPIGPDSNVIEVFISRLRKKIDGNGSRRLLRTKRGAGYLIDEEAP